MTAATPSNLQAPKTGAYHSQWIDLLRGLSALAVVLFHVRVDLWVGWKELRAHPDAYSTADRLAAFLSVLAPFFGSAVMLFFLVSGFCVHFAYAAKGRPFEIGPYARRRFFRIYPPYLAIVLLTVLVGWIVSRWFGAPVASVSTFAKSLFMVQNYGANAGQLIGNPSLWSLPVEAELYLIYPLFFWGCSRLGYKVALALVALTSGIALLLSLRLGASGGFNFSGNFLIYWIIWCGGAVLAEALKRDKLPQWKLGHSMISLLLLAAAMVATLKSAPVGVGHLLWASFYFMLMLWGLARPDAIRWPDRIKAPLLWLGSISYSLYLVHFPFFYLCGAIWQHQFGSKPSNFLISLCFVLLSLPVAALFYRFLELPSHTWARKFGAARAVPLPVTATRAK